MSDFSPDYKPHPLDNSHIKFLDLNPNIINSYRPLRPKLRSKSTRDETSSLFTLKDKLDSPNFDDSSPDLRKDRDANYLPKIKTKVSIFPTSNIYDPSALPKGAHNHRGRLRERASLPNLNIHKFLEEGSKILQGNSSAVITHVRKFDILPSNLPETYLKKNFWQSKPLGSKGLIKSQQDLIDMLELKRGSIKSKNSRSEFSYQSPNLTERRRETKEMREIVLEDFRVADLKVQKITLDEDPDSPMKDSPPFDNNIYKMQHLLKNPSLSQLKFEAEYHKKAHKGIAIKYAPILKESPNRNKYG